MDLAFQVQSFKHGFADEIGICGCLCQIRAKGNAFEGFGNRFGSAIPAIDQKSRNFAMLFRDLVKVIRRNII
jgi:hypothetical protein